MQEVILFSFCLGFFVPDASLTLDYLKGDVCFSDCCLFVCLFVLNHI